MSTSAERMAKMRERQKVDGFVSVTVVVHKDDKEALEKFVQSLQRPNLADVDMVR